MNPNRVLLMQLSERTSAKGNRYLAGWLGKASVVAFQAEAPDKFGNPVWEVFVSEPQPRPDQRPLPLERAPPAGGSEGRGPAAAPPPPRRPPRPNRLQHAVDQARASLRRALEELRERGDDG